MRKIVFLLLFSYLIVGKLHAQKEDVLYLKNQSVIRGKIILHDNNAIKIQNNEGSIFVFSTTEVDSIKQEKAWKNFFYKKKGFSNFTELGPLIAGKTTIDGVTTAAFSFQTINGYKFSQFCMTGIGVGADLYATQTIIPLFASFRGDLSSKGNVLPFYFCDFGYGINITQNSDNGTSFKGGVLYAFGLGLKIPFNRNAGFLLSAGYRYQKTSYTIDNQSKEIIYNRLAIRAGFFL